MREHERKKKSANGAPFVKDEEGFYQISGSHIARARQFPEML
jgi:hypothetical protein